MVPFFLVLTQIDAGTMIDVAREQVGGPRCRYDSGATDITVCGRRLADRYRLPLQTERVAGGAALDSARAERESLVHRVTPLEQLSPFLVGGGHVGVTTGVAFGPAGAGRPTIRGARPPAP
ncbi:hypothetical protein [Sphingomonas sp.]|uniref:hypothetical protein n=1 Tax=Sphingomonas sp. TaxID=28214 RepID=UPI003CC5FACE